MPFFLFSDAEAYKYHSQYYSKPSKEFEKYNPPATSTRFDFLSMIISKGKEDNSVDFEVNPEYFMQAYTCLLYTSVRGYFLNNTAIKLYNN